MDISSHLLYYLGWYLLVLLCTAVEATTATSGTVDVDLIFPRNNTYAPSELLPVIFAIQNPNLAAFLTPWFNYNIQRIDISNGTGWGDVIDLRWANFSSSGDPFYALSTVVHLIHTEGTWRFSWNLVMNNCSRGLSNDSLNEDIEFGESGQSNTLIFTTRIDSQSVDLVAATAHGNCAATESYAVNVTGILDTAPGHDGDNGHVLCAVLSPILPTPNPCAAKIDSTVVSSISASMTSTACETNNPVLSCPSPSATKNSACEAAQFSAGGWLVAAFSWLGYILI